MHPRIKGSLVVSLILLLVLLSPGVTNGSRDGTYPLNFLHKEWFGANSRKLLQVEIVYDYNEPGANSKHDPRGKRGGGGNHP